MSLVESKKKLQSGDEESIIILNHHCFYLKQANNDITDINHKILNNF